MAIGSSGNKAVDEMNSIKLSGNITPSKWYKEILKDNGRPDHLAVALLSDIVYWYRPVEVRDETTGYVTGLRKKFKGDLLQKTYEQYGEFFGEKKRIIKEAMDRLEKLGLIRKVFRDIVLDSGIKIPNVMYIEIFPEKIREITEEKIDDEASESDDRKMNEAESDPLKPEEKLSQTADSAVFAGGGTKFRKTSCENPYDLLRENVIPPTKRCTHIPQNSGGYLTMDEGAYTENTMETTGKNTTKNTTESTCTEYSHVNSYIAGMQEDDSHPVCGPVTDTVYPETENDDRTDRDIYISILQDQIDYEKLSREIPYCYEMDIVDGIINIIADIATTIPRDGVEKVNSRFYPHEIVKNRLLKTDYNAIKHVMDNIRGNEDSIRDIRQYLKTALYNARDEIGIVNIRERRKNYCSSDFDENRKKRDNYR